MGSKKYPVNLPYTCSPFTVEQNGSGGQKKKNWERGRSDKDNQRGSWQKYRGQITEMNIAKIYDDLRVSQTFTLEKAKPRKPKLKSGMLSR